MSSYQEFLFHILFACVATLAFSASLYLLLRRHNGIAPNITPPLRLRRWTAAFFAVTGTSHLVWLFVRYGPMEGDLFDRTLLCTAFDVVSTVPVLLSTMVVMLQDRRRPLWPIVLASALTFIYLLLIYFQDVRTTEFIVLPALSIAIFTIMLVRAVRQYDRWLLDNYADLEHKEARTSIGVMAAFILTSVAYGFANDYFFFEVLIEVANVLLIATLLWRVETMQELTDDADDDMDAEDANVDEDADADNSPDTSDAIYVKLESLLQQHCVNRQYYLQHNGTLKQLAKVLGTNRNYLSQHFAQQGLTYNSYINGLRIQHFIHLYEETKASTLEISVSKLAAQSGFSSYSTFSRAFRQVVGRTVTEWMEERS